jgi:hypothetical protein
LDDVTGRDQLQSETGIGQRRPYSTIVPNLAATSRVDTGLVNGTTHYYVVSAVSLNGEGANSVEANATPAHTEVRRCGAPSIRRRS